MSTMTLLLVSCELGSNSLGASHNGTRVDDTTIHSHATDSCYLPADLDSIKEKYVSKVNNVIKEHNIPDSLVINWDQTGCQLDN
jgi:hypothetical protein